MEVFLTCVKLSRFRSCLLHVRGGVSKACRCGSTRLRSSPRPWRCFHRSPRRRTRAFGLLHVRGGVSDERISIEMRIWVFSTSVEVFPTNESQSRCAYGSSPRPWRCFFGCSRDHPPRCVFSTSVEVFLTAAAAHAAHRGLLHVRGGVSACLRMGWRVSPSSPRPWRCFRICKDASGRCRVFSTSVEVFLATARAC